MSVSAWVCCRHEVVELLENNLMSLHVCNKKTHTQQANPCSHCVCCVVLVVVALEEVAECPYFPYVFSYCT